MTLELKTLRRMLETQLAQLAWKDLTRRSPLHTEMLRELTEIGIEQGLAAEIVTGLPKNCEANVARRHLGSTLRSAVGRDGRSLAGKRRAYCPGGTDGCGQDHGSGQTSPYAGCCATARAIWRWWPETRCASVPRIRYAPLGQLLGVPVFALDSLEQLPGVLARLGRFRMVLVDTPGAGQRDASLAHRLLTLSRAGAELQATLVLAASTQAGAVEEVVRRFAPARPTSCVLTKMDEAVTLGGLLSVLVRARLPITYISDGQRVPEDLRPRTCRGTRWRRGPAGANQRRRGRRRLLKRRFGDVAHALRVTGT